MSRITSVFAWSAFDSRGTPTVGCEVTLADGSTGLVHVPSGASTGRHEAPELRDGGDAFGGRGVHRAVANANGRLAAAVVGLDADDLDALDTLLADQPVEVIGANAILGVSLAAAVARAESHGESLWRDQSDEPHRPALLPMPMVNIVSGGAHAGRVLDVQDILVVPIGANSFAEAMSISWRIRRATAGLAAQAGYQAQLVADEGGLGPALPSNRAALQLVCDGIERAGLRPGVDAAIAIDVAATEFYRDGRYRLVRDAQELDSAGQVEAVCRWAAEFPVISIEDPLAEDDWSGWQAIGRATDRIQLLGDDLFVTDPARLERGIDQAVANAILIKPNQIGTRGQARAVVRQAHAAGYRTVVSARSGDTEDAWLADLAVGWRAGQIKVGSMMRSERTAKWNRLLYLEQRLGDRAELARFDR